MDLDAKKRVLRTFPSGVYVLGVRDDEAADGGWLTTVSWALQLSVEPPLVGVALETESRTLALIRAADGFTLGVLGEDGRGIAAKLGRASSDVPHKDAGVARTRSPALGAPIASLATGWLECRTTGELATGDHVLVVASVIDAGLSRDAAALTLQATGWLYGG